MVMIILILLKVFGVISWSWWKLIAIWVVMSLVLDIMN